MKPRCSCSSPMYLTFWFCISPHVQTGEIHTQMLELLRDSGKRSPAVDLNPCAKHVNCHQFVNTPAPKWAKLHCHKQNVQKKIEARQKHSPHKGAAAGKTRAFCHLKCFARPQSHPGKKLPERYQLGYRAPIGHEFWGWCTAAPPIFQCDFFLNKTFDVCSGTDIAGPPTNHGGIGRGVAIDNIAPKVAECDTMQRQKVERKKGQGPEGEHKPARLRQTCRQRPKQHFPWHGPSAPGSPVSETLKAIRPLAMRWTSHEFPPHLCTPSPLHPYFGWFAGACQYS